MNKIFLPAPDDFGLLIKSLKDEDYTTALILLICLQIGGLEALESE